MFDKRDIDETIEMLNCINTSIKKRGKNCVMVEIHKDSATFVINKAIKLLKDIELYCFYNEV